MSEETTAPKAASALEGALEKVITKSLDGMDAAVNFLSVQIPDVIHQLLVWKMVYYSLMCVVAAILVALVIWYWRFYYKKVAYYSAFSNSERPKNWFVDSEGYVEPGPIIVPVIVSLVTLLVSCMLSNLQWLMIWVAPKVWLIEYAASLARGGK